MSQLVSRVSVLTAGILAVVSVAAPPAIAGETTGSGGRTPIGEYRVPTSVCAFSGLNDVPDGSDASGDPFAAGRVQSFGDIVQQIARFHPGSIADMGGDLQANKPGVSCNKNRSLH